MVRFREVARPPTELWLEQPATARAMIGRGWSGMRREEWRAAGIQTQTVEVVPPSRPRMTLAFLLTAGISLSKSHVSSFLYLFISLSLSLSQNSLVSTAFGRWRMGKEDLLGLNLAWIGEGEREHWIRTAKKPKRNELGVNGLLCGLYYIIILLNL